MIGANAHRPSVALVAGASSGIGEATALRLAGEGITVALAARRVAELETLTARITDAGGHALAVDVDLAADGGPRQAVERTLAAVGNIDLLVCCAAMVNLSPIHEMTDGSWERQMRLNLTVPFELARAVLPGMRERRRGWIVNIGSGVAADVVPGSGAYGISKVGLNRLTELIHQENRDHNVHAYVVCPGWVGTRLAAKPRKLGVDPAQVLQPEDVADIIGWLVSRPSRVALGPVLRVEPLASDADAAAAMTRYIQAGQAGRTEVPA